VTAITELAEHSGVVPHSREPMDGCTGRMRTPLGDTGGVGDLPRLDGGGRRSPDAEKVGAGPPLS